MRGSVGAGQLTRVMNGYWICDVRGRVTSVRCTSVGCWPQVVLLVGPLGHARFGSRW